MALADVRGALAHPDLRRLWLAQVLSEVGDWAARLAVAVLVFDHTHSPALTGVVAALSLLPWVGLGPVVSAFVERYPRRSVLLVADLARAVLWGALVLPIPLWLLMACVFLAATASPPFSSARAALLPDIATSDYGAALGLTHMTSQTVQIIGFLFGGFLVALVGPPGAIGVNAASFGLSALLVSRLRDGRSVPGEPAARPWVRLQEATRVVLGDRTLRRAVGLVSAVQCSGAVVEALIVVYVHEQLHGSPAVVGMLSAVVAAGFLLTTAVVPTKRPEAWLLQAAALLGVAGSLLALIGFVTKMSGVLLPVPFAAVGVAFAATVLGNAVGGPRIPSEIRGSALGLLQAAVMGAQALGAMAGGVLAGWIGANAACAFALLPTCVYASYAVARPVVAKGLGIDDVRDETSVPRPRELSASGATPAA